MKTLALKLILLLASACGLQGSISTTLLIPQPIVAFGDTEDWTTTGSPDTDEMYMILFKPHFEYHYNGPVYKPIAEENIMEGTERDCNLLSLYKIKITQEFMSKNLILDLSQATPEKDSALTLEIAGYAALECIRMVANRYHHEVAVEIVAPVGQEETWLSTQKQFAAHDKSKPFKRKEGAAGQPAPRPEPDLKGGGNPFVLEHDADIVIYYNPDKDDMRMKISNGPLKNDKPRKVVREEKFSPTSKDLAEFFDEQSRKNLIVIIYEKNVLEDVECMTMATNLREYFVARGYKRISIQQATSGLSRPVYIDYKAEHAARSGGDKP